MIRRWLALFIACSMLAWLALGQAQPVNASVAPLSDQIFVSGRAVSFEHLASYRGEPVVRVDDNGFATMLQILGAKLQYQPGTRFVVVTRADGTLITFTVGSNVVSVDDTTIAVSFGPFYDDNALWVPLPALAKALALYTRSFRGGYAFAPQLLSIQRHIGQRRTVVAIEASAPLAWRANYGGNAAHPTLTLTFPGFANAASARIDLGGREAKIASIIQNGPPGFPITTLTVDAAHGVKFAAHHASASTAMDLVLARDEKDLAMRSPSVAPSVQISTQPTVHQNATPQAPQPMAQPKPSSPQPSVAPAISPVPTAVAVPEVTDMPSPSGSASPSASPEAEQAPHPSPSPLEKILNVFVTDTPSVSRVTLELTGPVSFEWHRLAPPDNRFWVDISQAALVGAAHDITVKLPVVRSVKISQHELTPDHVVRLIIEPTQPVDVVIGAIAGAPNELGIEIHDAPPPVDAAASGVGMLAPFAQSPGPQVAVTPGPKHPNLIVIDPGHGGNDPGALNQQYGLVESHLTLTIAQRLKALLIRDGWRVVLTRDGDYEVGDPAGDDRQELQARCDVANAAGARLFISVHINSSVSGGLSGLTTYYWRSADRTLAQSIQNSTVHASGAGDDGVKRENFYVIHHTVMPAVLIENAYLSNGHDAALLAQSAFLDRLAAGIAQGVKDYTGGPPSS